jgi:signal transduction histidine kinase
VAASEQLDRELQASRGTALQEQERIGRDLHDGRGVRASRAARRLALWTMARRAELVGGVLTVDAVEPSGTRIICTLAR